MEPRDVNDIKHLLREILKELQKINNKETISEEK